MTKHEECLSRGDGAGIKGVTPWDGVKGRVVFSPTGKISTLYALDPIPFLPSGWHAADGKLMFHIYFPSAACHRTAENGSTIVVRHSTGAAFLRPGPHPRRYKKLMSYLWSDYRGDGGILNCRQFGHPP